MDDTPYRKRTRAYRSGLFPRGTLGKRRRFLRPRLSRARAGPVIARFAQSRFRMRRNRAIYKRSSKYGETKLIALIPRNEVSPSVSLNPSAPHFTYSGFVLGSLPTGWDPSITPLGGAGIAQGYLKNQRIGDYVYMRKTHITLNIDTNKAESNQPPMQYRVIQFKSRRAVTPAGTVFNPGGSIFLDNSGDAFGYNTNSPTYNSTDYMQALTNKRDFVIKRDFKFHLSHPQVGGAATGYSGKYPVTKNITFDCGFYKKTHFNNATGQADDLDMAWCILVLARPVGKDTLPLGWESNVRGTTSFTDV